MGNQETARKPPVELSKKVKLATASIVIVIAVIFSVLWLGSDDDDLFSLSQIQDGFMCDIRQDHSSWSSKQVAITCDASGGNWWYLANGNLDTGLPAIEEFQQLPVGDTTLQLYVIDVEGDGMMGRGDSIIVKAVNSSSFLSNATYDFILWSGLLAVSGTEYRMSFWFENGGLETGPLKVTHHLD